MNVTFNVPKVLNNKVDSLLERIPYLSEVITGMSYNENDNVVELTVAESDPMYMVELKTSYEDLCNSLGNGRVVKERIVKSNLDSKLSVQPKENGSANLSYIDEKELILIEQLDKKFTSIAKKYGAVLREYPSVLNKSNMDRNQYHINFPQNFYGVTSVRHNYNAINNFRTKNQRENDSLEFRGEVLQPCICYHCYEEYQGRNLAEGKILTGKGKCFRHEIEWRKDNFRRSEFTMREIVYIGKEDWVVQTRNQIMEDVWDLFVSLGFIGRITTATDPFFFSQDLNTKGTYQLMSNAKYELIITTLDGKEVSIASFNYCQDILCTKYDIKDIEGMPLYSGCVAFGIDRWKESFINYHGRNIDEWPEVK